MAQAKKEVVSLVSLTLHQLCVSGHCLRSHIAEQTYGMYSVLNGSSKRHNEANKSRQMRDNSDENDLLSTFQGFSVFSSVSHPGTLQNITTKDLARVTTLC